MISKIKELSQNLVHVFSCKFSEISKNTLFTEYFWPTACESCERHRSFTEVLTFLKVSMVHKCKTLYKTRLSN